MTDIFLNILNISISSSWVILAVIMVRFLLQKSSKTFRYYLWIIVAIRMLLVPSFESGLSLIPSVETIPKDIAVSRVPSIHSGIKAVDKVINPVIISNFAPNPENSVNPLQIVLGVASVIWMIGAAVILLYFVISFIRIKASVRTAIRLHDNVWICDQIDSPFILGLFLPKIYLPSYTKEEEMTYILAHEEEHLKYHDTWWKPIGFLLLAIHWFNPLVWAAYILMCKDMEMACDERVIWRLDHVEKQKYAEVLLEFGQIKKSVEYCPVAFGEVGIKQRIQSIVHFKRPSGIMIVLFVLIMAVLGIGFLTNPSGQNVIPDTGSGPSKDDEPAEEIMEAFEALYKQDFTFVQITYGESVDNTLPEIQRISGAYDADNGIQHLIYVEGQKDWDEIYAFQEDGEEKTIINTEGTWTETNFSQTYFNGYGSDLTLDTAFKGTGYEQDLTIIDSYNTYYTVDIGKEYNLPLELKAMVCQQFGLERDSRKIQEISTDVYEIYEKMIIANQMQVNEISYDEALEKLEEIKKESEIAESIWVQITYEDVKLEIP